MKTLTVTSSVEILREAMKSFVTDLGGHIGHNWSMEQTNDSIWYTAHGYLNGECVQLYYNLTSDRLEVNHKLVSVVVEQLN